MRSLITSGLLFVVSLFFASNAFAAYLYSETLCHQAGFSCLTVQPGDTWVSLFPDDSQRDLVKRLNRMNVYLHIGQDVAVPTDPNMSYMDYAPFDKEIPAPGKKTIIFDPNVNAWGAYDADGNLVNWGPAAGGSDYCPDLHRPCHTPVGTFTTFAEGGSDCKSKIFPIPTGGAPMPYCTYFHGGYALHGSYEVPGFNASHGCVRMFPEDAMWLQDNFVELGNTKVIIKPYGDSSDSQTVANGLF